jgi:tRNA threonylcarbamoyladenosine biosynthesis protein TsaB
VPDDAILAFDTATAATAAAVLRAGRIAEARDDPPPGARPAHAARLLPLAAEAMRAAGCGWGDLGRIAVGVGPGSFTGLRIGVATARGLAQATGLPLAPVSSLRALAEPALAAAPAVLAVLDARRGEAFAAAWGAGFAVLGAPAVLAPAELARAAAALPAGGIAVGDGALRFRLELEQAGAEVPPEASPWHRVAAAAVCRLGAEAETVPLGEVTPDYLRAPDAEPSAARP